jgi:transcriptional regulator with XRE-family HTH domain
MAYSIRMSSNCYLHSLREAKGWSLKQASKATHISLFRLSCFENGYLRIPENLYPDLALVYEVPVDSFNDVLAYPTPLPEEKKTSPMAEKFQKFLIAWPTLISVYVLFAIALGFFISGYTSLMKIGNSTEQIYSSEVQSLDAFVLSKGEVDSDNEKSSLAYTETNGNSLTVEAPLDKRLATTTAFVYAFPRENETITLTLSANHGSAGFSYEESDDTSLSLTVYQGTGRIENDHYVLEALMDENYDNVTDQTLLEQKQALISSYESAITPLFQSWCTKNGASYTLSPNEFVFSIAKSNALLSSQIDFANNALLYATLFGVIFLFGSVLLTLLKIVASKKKKIYALAVSAPDLPSREKNPHPLSPNWKIQPFIPETAFRLAGVILILISSIMLFQIALKIFNSEDILITILSEATNIIHWVQLMPLIPLATTLWFFIRIEILHTTENVIPTIILTFFLGLIYYFSENSFLFYFQLNNDSYRETLITIAMSMMPGNLFWGMCCFSLIILFLLTTPKFHKKSSLVLWRLLSLLPVAYLLFSYFYALGVNLWGWTA